MTAPRIALFGLNGEWKFRTTESVPMWKWISIRLHGVRDMMRNSTERSRS